MPLLHTIHSVLTLCRNNLHQSRATPFRIKLDQQQLVIGCRKYRVIRVRREEKRVRWSVTDAMDLRSTADQ